MYIEKSLVELLPKTLADGRRPSFVEIVEVDSAGENSFSFRHDIGNRINARLDEMESAGIEDPVVTVSRLDNDDALSHDFLTTLARLSLSKAALCASPEHIITFPHGVQYLDMRTLSTYLFNNNHFVNSYHKTRVKPETLHAMSFNHGHLFAKAKDVLVINTDQPMWVEIVHGNNVSNKYHLRLALQHTGEFDARFGAEYATEPGAGTERPAATLTLKRELQLTKDSNDRLKVLLNDARVTLKATKVLLNDARATLKATKAKNAYRLGETLAIGVKSPANLVALPGKLCSLWREVQAHRRARAEPGGTGPVAARQTSGVVASRGRESAAKQSDAVPSMHLRPSDTLLTGLNRDAMLKLLPSGGVGIEIGVNRGAYSKKIVALAAPKVLHLIDPWPTDSTDDYIKTYRVKDDMQAHYDMVRADFAPQIAQGRIVVHRKYSRECASLFVDGQLDFVYVDGMHSYEACLEDLRLFGPKLKGTGFLMGHDFSNTVMGRRKRFGVIRAVSEFLEGSDFRPVLVTLESAPSYVLTRHHASRERMIAQALDLAPGVLTPLERLITMEQVPVALSKRTAQVMRL